ncbi:MAG: serine/threonine protein kinase [Myxococcota bacterium]|nr:serine/threonine protein kinase [Myxococcota bacterium]
MASTPAQRFVCPRCRHAFEEECRYCRECGADMTRASPLEAAGSQPVAVELGGSASIDRRLSDSNQAWLGKIVDGRYKVLEVIGRGGMGVVYRVEHLRMGKIAAMKVLHRDLAEDTEVLARFEREAAAVSRLHHPHTVQVFDFGNAQGALYLLMEYVRGQDLARIIERDGPMPWSRAAPLLAQICGALQEAHEFGIVHRDLKPENVLITRSTAGRDYAKVLDFGLAKLDTRNAPKRETERQQIVGTPYFMSPEQIRGEEVDTRSDIYSFGALMFELLTGQHLYNGTTAVGVLTKHLTAEPDAPSIRAQKLGIPPAVDHLCRKALARDPGERWQTAAQLGEAIEEVFRETVTDTTGPGQRTASKALRGGSLVLDPAEHGASEIRLRRSDIDAFEAAIRRRRVLGWLVLIALVLGAGGAAAWWATREPATVTTESEPNHETRQADRIALGTVTTGYLGKRLSPSEGDRDTYVVKLTGARHVVSVSVTGVPNLDLVLTVHEGEGLRTMTIDEGGIGDGEVLHRRVVEGRLVITIGQVMAPGQRHPVENVSDPYELRVTEEVVDAGEAEPNNSEADANPLALTYELRGYLDARRDVDLLRWTGETGAYIVVVRADGLPLQWRTADGKARTPGEARLQLTKGELIRLERADRGSAGGAKSPLPGRDAPWSIVVVR